MTVNKCHPERKIFGTKNASPNNVKILKMDFSLGLGQADGAQGTSEYLYDFVAFNFAVTVQFTGDIY